jgi:hypothetical protein
LELTSGLRMLASLALFDPLAAQHVALGVASSTAHVRMSNILSAADWSHAPKLLAASKQFPLLMVG